MRILETEIVELGWVGVSVSKNVLRGILVNGLDGMAFIF